MFTIITSLVTTLFQIWIVRKFMSVFFQTNIKEKGKKKVFYLLFFLVVPGVHLGIADTEYSGTYRHDVSGDTIV